MSINFLALHEQAPNKFPIMLTITFPISDLMLPVVECITHPQHFKRLSSSVHYSFFFFFVVIYNPYE